MQAWKESILLLEAATGHRDREGRALFNATLRGRRRLQGGGDDDDLLGLPPQEYGDFGQPILPEPQAGVPPPQLPQQVGPDGDFAQLPPPVGQLPQPQQPQQPQQGGQPVPPRNVWWSEFRPGMAVQQHFELSELLENVTEVTADQTRTKNGKSTKTEKRKKFKIATPLKPKGLQKNDEDGRLRFSSESLQNLPDSYRTLSWLVTNNTPKENITAGLIAACAMLYQIQKKDPVFVHGYLTAENFMRRTDNDNLAKWWFDWGGKEGDQQFQGIKPGTKAFQGIDLSFLLLDIAQKASNKDLINAAEKVQNVIESGYRLARVQKRRPSRKQRGGRGRLSGTKLFLREKQILNDLDTTDDDKAYKHDYTDQRPGSNKYNKDPDKETDAWEAIRQAQRSVPLPHALTVRLIRICAYLLMCSGELQDNETFSKRLRDVLHREDNPMRYVQHGDVKCRGPTTNLFRNIALNRPSVLLGKIRRPQSRLHKEYKKPKKPSNLVELREEKGSEGDDGVREQRPDKLARAQRPEKLARYREKRAKRKKREAREQKLARYREKRVKRKQQEAQEEQKEETELREEKVPEGDGRRLKKDLDEVNWSEFDDDIYSST